jgi:adenylate cyclase
VLLYHNVNAHQIGGGFLRSLFTGLVTTIVAFFVLQFFKQKWSAPYFFPDGGLHRTPQALRIRISTRLAALLCACNIVPFVGILHMLHHTPLSGDDPGPIIEGLTSSLTTDILVFMVMGLLVTVLVTRNLTRPLKNIIRVLSEVRKGNFNEKVQVTTNDEIGYSGDVINEMTDGLKERDFIKETFGKYITEEIRDEILSGNIPLDGEIKEVTVLFADLRNFTPMAESTPPKEVVKIINGYFEEMEAAIHRNDGLVLQYVGDEIEAVFGAPIRRDRHPIIAVHAALEMRKRLGKVNSDLEKRGYRPLLHGIGIHTGKVVAANIGSPHRLSYALVGDTVNLASRLQELNKDFNTDIIISGATRAHLEDRFSLKRLPHTQVRGRQKPVEIFTLA